MIHIADFLISYFDSERVSNMLKQKQMNYLPVLKFFFLACATVNFNLIFRDSICLFHVGNVFSYAVIFLCF